MDDCSVTLHTNRQVGTSPQGPKKAMSVLGKLSKHRTLSLFHSLTSSIRHLIDLVIVWTSSFSVVRHDLK